MSHLSRRTFLQLDVWLKKTNDMAGRLTAAQMVEQGIIRPRDAQYEERRATGAVRHELQKNELQKN